MDDDDELCLCFHVTKRKVTQYIRNQRPRVASQLSQCYGAGTGCGWCRPFLRRLLEESRKAETGQAETRDADHPRSSDSLPDAATYAQNRRDYRKRQT